MSKKDPSDLDRIVKGVSTLYNVGEFLCLAYVIWQLWEEHKAIKEMEEIHAFADEICVLMYDRDFYSLETAEKKSFEEKFGFLVGCVREVHGAGKLKIDILHEQGIKCYKELNEASLLEHGVRFVSLTKEQMFTVWEKIQQEKLKQEFINYLVWGGLLCVLFFVFVAVRKFNII